MKVPQGNMNASNLTQKSELQSFAPKKTGVSIMNMRSTKAVSKKPETSKLSTIAKPQWEKEDLFADFGPAGIGNKATALAPSSPNLDPVNEHLNDFGDFELEDDDVW
jgi:hypothetical protein